MENDRVESASQLLQWLVSASPDTQMLLSTDERFHRLDLLEMLLVQAQSSQLTSCQEAERLATLADQLGQRIQDDPDAARSIRLRAHCRLANGYRLHGRLSTADQALCSAHAFLDARPGEQEEDRAIFSRALALLRWQQGRLEEALALLRHTSSLFLTCSLRFERNTSSLLLALLEHEMGMFESLLETMAPLLDETFDKSWHPSLTSRAFLTFAAVAASRTKQLAISAFQAGLRFLAYVSDPLEQLRLYSFEGRARACLGYAEPAEKLLDSVRRRYLHARLEIDLILASLDLLALRSAAGCPLGKRELLQDIEDLCSESSKEAPAVFDRYLSADCQDNPWGAARSTATWYLQSLRLAGVCPALVPFA